MMYAEALAFLDARINYEQRGMPDARELRLDRVHRLLAALGDPHRRYRVVHIAGTKGKGSTASMTAALLGESGFRVGLHTSPHFHQVEERFRVDGRIPTPETFASLVAEVEPVVRRLDFERPAEQPELTFFEITTAMMFLHFAREAVDWAVVEVGMGGRLDCTNVVDPEVSVVTSISLDHMAQLGNTVEAIAREKAGIIKPGKPVVASLRDPRTREVIRAAAVATQSPLREIDRDFTCCYRSLGLAGGEVDVRTWRGPWPRLKLKMMGEHQAVNAATSAACIDQLRDSGHQIACTGESLGRLTMPGRIEVLSTAPVAVLVDAAHNEASTAALARAVKETAVPAGPKVLVFASSRDKDWRAMLRTLADGFDHVVLTQYRRNLRALPIHELASGSSELRCVPILTADPTEAWIAAKGLVNPSDGLNGPSGLICATGSFFLAAEIRELMLTEPIVTGSVSVER